MAEREPNSHAGKSRKKGKRRYATCYLCDKEFPTSTTKSDVEYFAKHKRHCFEQFPEEKLKQRLKSMDEDEKKSMEESFNKNVRILETRKNNIKTELKGCTRVLQALFEIN